MSILHTNNPIEGLVEAGIVFNKKNKPEVVQLADIRALRVKGNLALACKESGLFLTMEASGEGVFQGTKIPTIPETATDKAKPVPKPRTTKVTGTQNANKTTPPTPVPG